MLHDFGDIVIMLVYVKDIVIYDNNAFWIQSLVTHLHSVFSLQDLSLHYFFGIEVSSSSQGLHLVQDLIHRPGLQGCKLVSTLKNSRGVLGKNIGVLLDDETISAYRSLVGAIDFLGPNEELVS